MQRIFISFILSGLISLVCAQTLPKKSEILSAMQLANGYFMKKWPDPTTAIITDKTRPSNLWTRGTYYEGLMQLYCLTSDTILLKYAVDWGTFHKWQPTYTTTTPTRIADNQCCFQTYLELYQLDPSKSERISTAKTSIDVMVNSTKMNDWWWIDALHMAMPVFTKFGIVTGENKYYEKMYDLYNYSKNLAKGVGLYNYTDSLWYRDSVYLPPKKSPNGLQVYWSRGNGWVFAALTRTLDVMPVGAPHRDEYIKTFKEMAGKLIRIQREDGFWNVNLGDPNDYGGKESSGTVFFTYGLAWGVKNGILESGKFLQPALKAWNGLITDALHSDGAIGYMQSSGSKPADGQPLSYDKMPNFEDFGLGGFLLAGSEMYRLIDKLEKTGLTPLKESTSICVYPNPVNKESNFTITSEQPICDLKVIDITGKIIYSERMSGNTQHWCSDNFPLHELKAGLYMAEIQTENHVSSVKLLVTSGR